MIRISIKIQRTPITMLTEAGYTKHGGWMLFDKPLGSKPPKISHPKTGKYKVLWCPYCGEWNLFKYIRENGRYECQGYCGWSHSDEYYVKNANDLWFEEVPLADLKKVDLSILKPRPRRSFK